MYSLGLHLDDPALDHKDRRLSGATAFAVTRNRDKWLAPIKNQKQSNACVGFSGSTALAWAEFLATDKIPPKYSPLFGWTLTRIMEGDGGDNVGCSIRDFADVATRYGVCSEDEWPFELSAVDDYKTRLSQRPPASAYEEAARHQILGSYVIGDGDLSGMWAALQRGLGYQFGMPALQSFFDVGSDGFVGVQKGTLAGWHAVYAWDADVVNGVEGAWCDNSWSESWGKQGRFFLPASELVKTQDLRVYTKIELMGEAA